jgi:dienelactone hydrolase
MRLFMRPFENLLTAIALLGLSALFINAVLLGQGLQGKPATGANFITFSSAMLLLQAAREGLRWQMGPAYLALVLLDFAVFFSIFGLRTPDSSLSLAGILCIAASCALRLTLPMFRFAPTTGPYTVGTCISCLIDASREDESPSRHRELMVQLWYPAEPSRHPFATYRRTAETTRISSYQSVLKTSSRLDAPLAKTGRPFPILLFNPAWNGRRTQNTFLVEELASHGFVVAAVDHTHNSEPVAFPDGRVVMAVHVRAMEDVSSSTAEEVQRIGNAEVARQVLDNRFVLDELARWNQQQGSKWYQRLDTENAGALGHSLGGATAIECWASDGRVRTAMNMDGWTFGAQAATGRRASLSAEDSTTKPLLFIYEGNYEPFPDADLRKSSAKSEVEQQVDDWDAAQ